MIPRLLALLTALAVLAGCSMQLATPRTFAERVAYVEAQAQAAYKSLDEITCWSPDAAGYCAGRPVSQDDSKRVADEIRKVRAALKTAARLDVGKLAGDCLDEVRDAEGCLAAARRLLLTTEETIRNRQARKP